jgi:hypothetical protein
MLGIRNVDRIGRGLFRDSRQDASGEPEETAIIASGLEGEEGI